MWQLRSLALSKEEEQPSRSIMGISVFLGVSLVFGGDCVFPRDWSVFGGTKRQKSVRLDTHVVGGWPTAAMSTEADIRLRPIRLGAI